MKLNWNTILFDKKVKVNIAVQSDVVSNSQYSLTPSTIEKKIVLQDDKGEKTLDNPAYQSILDIAGKLKEKEIKNIALTGPFGSGKSSVLLTLQKDFPQYNYLPISLATLDGLSDKKENIEENINTKESDSINQTKSPQKKESKKRKIDLDDEALNRKIEYSILQQLIYKEKADDIPQSRFKRIRHISNWDSYSIAFGTVLFILSSCILFEPKFLRIQSLYRFFACNENWKIFWDILLLGYVIFAAVSAISKLTIKTYNNKINKLNLKDGEIGIEESTSIFNKHLDEIIYFFEVTRYDIVIIEDLDRFDTPNIFLKLRELNCLLNNSNAINRKIGRVVFIYAIRDDIFKDTSRTKFFDYISTVIPVINPSNSRDKLLNALRDKGITEISDDVCMDIGIYIDDMRILRNTVNEFIQYRQKLQDNLSPKKMLGMILYKNYHPDDFAKLHNQKGIVYNIISNRVKYHNVNIGEKESEINNLQLELNQITNFYFNEKAKDLRVLYIMKYIETIRHIQYFKEDNTHYTPTQLIEDDKLFQKLEDNIFTYYYNDQSGSSRLSITFKEIEKKVDPNHTYRERLNFRPQRVTEINNKIEKLKHEILELRTLSLSQILNNYSNDDFYKDAKGIKLIAFLIRAGYIDESYYDYISYFYPGVMTPSDRDFILDLKIGQKKTYNYVIYKPKAVINDIHESLFSKVEVLNISLLDFIVENKNEYSLQYISIINNIKKNNALDFIETYYIEGKQIALFFNDFLPVWSQFFQKTILKAKSKESADINLEIFLRYFPKSKIKEYNNVEFKNYISEKFYFIAQKLDIILIDNVRYLTEYLNLKYNILQVESSVSKELISFITDGKYYRLTSKNIQCILNAINPELGKKYEFASYSSIIEAGNDNLINYINEDIEECISKIFPDSSIEENSKSIISIVSNTDMADVTKIEYLSRQVVKIDLSDIDEECWDVAIKANVIKPIWQNIEKYISIETNKDFNSTIIDFISKNSPVLSQQQFSNTVSALTTISNIFTKLIGGNILPIESYKYIRKSFNRTFISFDFSSLPIDRIDFLIETNTIKFNDYNYKLIDNHFKTLVDKFIVKNKNEYISNISSYPLTETTAYNLLKGDQLTLREKILIIESLSTKLLDKNVDLSNEICTIINSSKKTIADKTLVLELLRNGNNLQQKLNLFVRECIELKYEKEFVKSGLSSLGGDYAAISLQKGQRRKFIFNKDNKLLAEYLENNNFISKQYEKNGLININARNI